VREMALKILVADDSDRVAKATGRALVSLGSVEMVSKLYGAMLALNNAAKEGQPFDLLMLDIHMSNGDLASTVRMIRELSPGTHILATSNQPDGESAAKALGLFFIPRPFAKNELFLRVTEVVQQDATPAPEKIVVPTLALRLLVPSTLPTEIVLVLAAALWGFWLMGHHLLPACLPDGTMMIDKWRGAFLLVFSLVMMVGLLRDLYFYRRVMLFVSTMVWIWMFLSGVWLDPGEGRYVLYFVMVVSSLYAYIRYPVSAGARFIRYPWVKGDDKRGG
jgi:CheY-like chemotaxis protein